MRKFYAGTCVGGPRKGQPMISPDPVYPLSRMARNWERTKQEGDSVVLPWIEIGRGEYHFESGHWWWKGWDK